MTLKLLIFLHRTTKVVLINRPCGPVSKDREINEFGKYLLNMCAQFSLIILNGTLGGECGKFIYISTFGCSVIDYFIVSRQLLHMPISLHVAEKIE